MSNMNTYLTIQWIWDDGNSTYQNGCHLIIVGEHLHWSIHKSVLSKITERIYSNTFDPQLNDVNKGRSIPSSLQWLQLVIFKVLLYTYSFVPIIRCIRFWLLFPEKAPEPSSIDCSSGKSDSSTTHSSTLNHSRLKVMKRVIIHLNGPELRKICHSCESQSQTDQCEGSDEIEAKSVRFETSKRRQILHFKRREIWEGIFANLNRFKSDTIYNAEYSL